MPHLTVLAIAYLFALPIGWNREREERSAGLRTFPLVRCPAVVSSKRPKYALGLPTYLVAS